MEDKVIDIGNLKVPSIPSKKIGMGLAAILILAGLSNTPYQVQPEKKRIQVKKQFRILGI